MSLLNRNDQCIAPCLVYYLCWCVSQSFDHSCGPYIAKYVTKCVGLHSCKRISQRVDQCLGLKIAQWAKKCLGLIIRKPGRQHFDHCVGKCFGLCQEACCAGNFTGCLPGAQPSYGLVCHYVSRPLLLLASQPSCRPEPSLEMALCVANCFSLLLSYFVSKRVVTVLGCICISITPTVCKRSVSTSGLGFTSFNVSPSVSLFVYAGVSATVCTTNSGLPFGGV